MYIYEKETYEIRGAVFEVYKRLGLGLQESVYQSALERELEFLGIPFESQRKLEISYRNELLVQYFVVDFICYDKILVEIKSVERLSQVHRAQLLNYLKLSDKRLGLLVNFNAYPQVVIEKMINSE